MGWFSDTWEEKSYSSYHLFVINSIDNLFLIYQQKPGHPWQNSRYCTCGIHMFIVLGAQWIFFLRNWKTQVARGHRHNHLFFQALLVSIPTAKGKKERCQTLSTLKCLNTILTGMRLSELSNTISTKAEITLGPVPSWSKDCLCSGRRLLNSSLSTNWIAILKKMVRKIN